MESALRGAFFIGETRMKNLHDPNYSYGFFRKDDACQLKRRLHAEEHDPYSALCFGEPIRTFKRKQFIKKQNSQEIDAI